MQGAGNMDRWPRMLTKKEAAEYVGVCPSTFDALRITQATTIGTRKTVVRFDRKVLDEYLDKQSGIGTVSPSNALDGWMAKRGGRTAERHS